MRANEGAGVQPSVGRESGTGLSQGATFKLRKLHRKLGLRDVQVAGEEGVNLGRGSEGQGGGGRADFEWISLHFLKESIKNFHLGLTPMQAHLNSHARKCSAGSPPARHALPLRHPLRLSSWGAASQKATLLLLDPGGLFISFTSLILHNASESNYQDSSRLLSDDTLSEDN